MSTAQTENVWSLICITRLGKVSILRHLSLREAREAYKKLLPDERPKRYIFSEHHKKYGYATWGRSYVPQDDFLERVEFIGPEGQDLDPWHGVEPLVIDTRTPEERLRETTS